MKHTNEKGKSSSFFSTTWHCCSGSRARFSPSRHRCRGALLALPAVSVRMRRGSTGKSSRWHTLKLSGGSRGFECFDNKWRKLPAQSNSTIRYTLNRLVVCTASFAGKPSTFGLSRANSRRSFSWFHPPFCSVIFSPIFYLHSPSISTPHCSWMTALFLFVWCRWTRATLRLRPVKKQAA